MMQKNPVDYMLDSLSRDLSEGVGFVPERPLPEVIPEKQRKSNAWWKKKTEAEKKRIEDAIKRRHKIVDELWERYK